MKFSFLINQAAVVEYGFEKHTDLTDWAFIDYLLHWQTNPKAKRQNGFVWLDYKHIIKETPLLGLRAKQSISNRVKKLVDLGLIEVEKDNFKRAYFQITSLTHQIVSFRACPNRGTPVPSQEHPVLFEEQGVPEKGHITNQHLTNHQEQTKKKNTKKKKLDLSDIDPPKNLNTSAWQKWMTYKRELKKTYTTPSGIKTAMKDLAKLTIEQQQNCIDEAVSREWQGFITKNYTGVTYANNKPKQSIFEQNMAAHQKDIECLMGKDADDISSELVIDERTRLLN